MTLLLWQRLLLRAMMVRAYCTSPVASRPPLQCIHFFFCPRFTPNHPHHRTACFFMRLGTIALEFLRACYPSSEIVPPDRCSTLTFLTNDCPWVTLRLGTCSLTIIPNLSCDTCSSRPSFMSLARSLDQVYCTSRHMTTMPSWQSVS